jgi:hypothetical protein
MSDHVVERLLGSPVVAGRTLSGGYTHASRRVVTLADGRTASAALAQLHAPPRRSPGRKSRTTYVAGGRPSQRTRTRS